jgi:hypothetical protein
VRLPSLKVKKNLTGPLWTFLGLGLCVAFITFVRLPNLKVRTYLNEHSYVDFLGMGLCAAFIAFVRLPRRTSLGP